MIIPKKYEKQVKEYLKELRHRDKKLELSRKYRNRFTKFWNENLDLINKDIILNKASFEWDQLVRQELVMWASLAEPVYKNGDFKLICDRRDFSNKQKKFIMDALKYMGLWGGDKQPKEDKYE